MSIEAHSAAMDSYAEAQAAQRAGDTKAARQLLLKAAELESKAFDSIPEGRSKTRGIVAVSAVSLYVEAGEAKQASRLAARFLHEADLSEEHRRELIDLLVDVERRARATLRGVASSQLFDVSLRGATVGIGGVIPLETVLLKFQQFRSYFLRVGEFVTDQPFRQRGAEQPDGLHGLIPLLAPSTVGSYRFQIGLEAQIEQLQLLGTAPFDPGRVADEAFRILSVTIDGPEFLQERVKNTDYADWFSKAVRNIAPTGKGLEQVQVLRQDTHDAATLNPEARKRLDRHIRASRKSSKSQEAQEVELSGVLRALDLNRGWLLLVRDGQNVRCEIGREVWDDIVGPLVNHEIRVSARKKGSSFEALDIAEAD